jgi:hypothetical protein
MSAYYLVIFNPNLLFLTKLDIFLHLAIPDCIVVIALDLKTEEKYGGAWEGREDPLPPGNRRCHKKFHSLL